MPDKSPNISFTVIPGTPTLLGVKGSDGHEYQITLKVGALAVRETPAKNAINGYPVFEVDLSFGLDTARKSQ